VSLLVRAHELGRWYGEVVGLNELSVEIETGVTGLIGPNGAGKSTFMKLLVGEMRPSRGTIEVLGHNPFANRELYRQLGFCPQQDALYEHLSGLQFVTNFLRLSGFDLSQAKQMGARALERVHLGPAMQRRISGYSKGMRQRVKLAQAIAHEPRLIVADEPLTGLDPVARHLVIDLFHELGENGTSVLISSHVLHEVQSLTPRIVLIHRGRLLAQGSVSDVRRLLSRHPRQVHFRAREPRRLAEACLQFDHVGAIRFDPEDERSLFIETRDVEALFQALPAISKQHRLGIQSFESPDANLEAVFDYLVG
jgi:ABC-2 type transport system ATP-binding protein